MSASIEGDASSVLDGSFEPNTLTFWLMRLTGHGDRNPPSSARSWRQLSNGANKSGDVLCLLSVAKAGALAQEYQSLCFPTATRL